jgi:hypothetical protein
LNRRNEFQIEQRFSLGDRYRVAPCADKAGFPDWLSPSPFFREQAPKGGAILKRTRFPISPPQKPMREKARSAVEQKEGRERVIGVWLNARTNPKFDNCYDLNDENREKAKIIQKECAFADRADSFHKLVVLISNLLRYRDTKPIIIALSKEPTFSPLVRILNEKGFIELWRGNKMMVRTSRIYPTNKLLAHFENVHTSGIVINPVNLIEVYDDDDNIIENYSKTDKSRRMEAILKKTNRINRNATILIGNRTVSTALIAIFHRKFTLYGRLHTKGCLHYQGFSEKKRLRITINGDSVVELDFSGLHPHLLYAQAGFQLENDPYSKVLDTQDKYLRGFLKVCLLKMINSTSCKVAGRWVTPIDRKKYYRKSYIRSAKANAEGSINQDIGYDAKLRDKLKEHGITTARQVIDRFKKEHVEISHHFFSDNETGLRTMNKDAAIAIDVVELFAEKGWPILAIHDSFVVQEQHRDELKSTMDRIYKKHNKGFFCPIK